MAYKLPDIILYNGNKMPIIGLGTQYDWQLTGKAVDTALEVGYRHFDTAYSYGNEKQMGEVLKKWITSGKVKREELFIVTKLPTFGNRRESVEKYIKKSLEALQLDYVDLYLIHHPVGMEEEDGSGGPARLDMKTDIISLWKGMEAQVDAGRAKAIGLSNFNSEQIKRICKSARIKPANLQIEMHVYFQQKELIAFCNALDITIVSYGTVGSQGMYQLAKDRNLNTSEIPQQNPLTDPVVQRIADKFKKTTAQVLLRHTMQLGIAVIPKSSNPERIKQNFDVFDFQLSPEDMEELDALDEGPKARKFNASISPDWAKHPEMPYKIRY